MALAAFPSMLLAQSLADRYTFSTGTDPTLWVPMPPTADTLLYPNTPNQTGTGNYWQAQLNLGFDFVYGYHSVTYNMETHLYVNDDGMIRMGYHAGDFTVLYNDGDPWHLGNWINCANFVNVINGYGHDGLLDSVSYVCTWIDTTQSNDRRVIEFMLADNAHPEKHLKYQVHLEENTNDITIVYADINTNDYPTNTYQIGINTGVVSGHCGNINIANNTVLWDQTNVIPGNSNVWPGAHRWYKFSYRPEVATVPYFQDFDQIDQSYFNGYGRAQTLPDGWHSLSPYGSFRNIPDIYQKQREGGTMARVASSHPNVLNLVANLSFNAVVLPLFDVPLDSLRLDLDINDVRFNYNDTLTSSITYNTENPRLFVVGIYRPGDLFVPLDSIYNTQIGWPERHTVYFNVYDSLIAAYGPGARIALYSPYIPFYVDDVAVRRNIDDISCLPARNLKVDTLTLHSATLSWDSYSDSSTTWWYEYGPLGFTHGNGYSEYLETTSVSLTGLAEGTPYDFYLWSECGSGDTLHISFTTEASPVMTLPYATGFEDGEDQAWHFENCVNGWVVGSATSSTGNKSMYISCDGGKYNRFSNNNSGSFALKTFHINTAGIYTIRYDWHASGSWDNYMRVALVPASDTTIVAGVNPYPPITVLNNDTLAIPAGWRRAGYQTDPQFFGPDRMCEWPNWTTFEDTLHFSIEDTGFYRMVFFYYTEFNVSESHFEFAPAIDNVWFGIETCPAVKDLEATHLTTSSATVTWTAGGSETTWSVSLDGTVVGTTTTPSYTFPNLESGSEHTASVRALCSTTDSSGAISVKFHTLECAPIAIPYVQNFDSLSSVSVQSLPVCWEYKMTNPTWEYTVWDDTYSPTIFRDSTNAASGEYSLRLWKEAITILPPLDEPMNTLQLDFDVMPVCNAVTYSHRLIVGVMEGQLFVPYDTVVFNTRNTYQHVTIYMGDYTGIGNRIAFYNQWINGTESYNDAERSSIRIDNITVTLSPQCVSPTRLTTTQLTHNSVSFRWVANGASTWKVEYGPTGFTPGTGTVDTAYTNSCTLSGLASVTAYDCYITPICSLGTAAAVQFSFVTRNVPVTTLPYYTSFEPGDDTNWEILNDTNGWYIGSATNAFSEHSLYISADSGATNHYSSTKSFSFAMRDFVVDTPGDYTVAFDWHNDGAANNAYMRVFLVPSSYTIVPDSNNGISAGNVPEGWINVGSCDIVWGHQLQMIQHPNWEHFETTITIDSADLDTYSLLFYWYNNNSSILYQPPAAVDNVAFGIIPCEHPATITLDSVTSSSLSFHWDVNNNPQLWEVWCDNQLVGTTLMGGYTLTGLQSSTNYNIAVRGICGVADTSLFTRATFTTECGPHILTQSHPLFEDFESPTPPALCWSIINNSVDNPLTHTTSETYSGAQSFRFSSWEEDTYDEYDQYLISPELECTESIYLSFMARNASSGDKIKIGYSTTTPDLSSMTWESTWRKPPTTNTWVEMRDTFPPETKYIAFHYYADYMYYFYIDSVVISTNAVDCFVPVLTDSTKTYRNIDITWDLSDSTEIIFYEGNMFFDTVTSFVCTAGNYSFTGLTPATTYTIALRDICDSTHYSDWNIFFITTDDLECIAPVTVTASASFTSAHITWTAGGSEVAWQVHLFDAVGYDALIPVTMTSADLTNLSQGWTYSVAVRPMCGFDNEVEGPWSDTVDFTTDACEAPTEVTATAITSTTATITWTPSANSTGSYYINYGLEDFTTGSGIVVPVTGTSFMITDLEPLTTYDVYVESQCAGNALSVWTTVYQFTTEQEGISDTPETGSVKLYPNPSNSVVTIAVEGMEGDATVSIVDLNGREVLQTTMNESVMSLDVSGLSKGAYFLRLTGERMNTIRKLLVL